jgi:hypothetical protein
MRPTAILAIVNEIVLRRPSVIVECGSGNSTVFAARALAQHAIAGRIDSIDHHPDWAALTTAAIERDNLQQWASVTTAPLKNGWYDVELVPDLQAIDMLVVDGPPAYDPEIALARQPALDHFATRLKAGAMVLLDDSWRSGEKWVLAEWQKRHGLSLDSQSGGYAIGTYAPSQAPP